MTSLVKAIQERLAKICENVYGGPAHSYASENATTYRIQDAAIAKCAAAIRAADLSDLEPKVIGARECELETQVAAQAAEIKRLKWILHKIVSLDNDAHPGLFTWHDMRAQAHKEAEAVLATKEANNG